MSKIQVLNDNIKKLRKAHGFTQAELAQLLHKSASAVRMWELGKNSPDNESLLALSKIFNVTTDFLLNNNQLIEEESVIDTEIKKISTHLKSLNSKQFKLVSELIKEISKNKSN